jgi:hypothetical protein
VVDVVPVEGAVDAPGVDAVLYRTVTATGVYEDDDTVYLSSGGWIRRPLPPITLVPRLLVLPGGVGVSLAGRF